jgi:hypothetical protein
MQSCQAQRKIPTASQVAQNLPSFSLVRNYRAKLVRAKKAVLGNIMQASNTALLKFSVNSLQKVFSHFARQDTFCNTVIKLRADLHLSQIYLCVCTYVICTQNSCSWILPPEEIVPRHQVGILFLQLYHKTSTCIEVLRMQLRLFRPLFNKITWTENMLFV